MLNPFNVLRQMARTAVINGVNEGLAAVVEVTAEPLEDMEALRQRIANNLVVAALPAAEEAIKKEKRK